MNHNKSEIICIREIPQRPKERLVFLFDKGLDLAGKNAEDLGFSVEEMQRQRKTWVMSQLAMSFSKDFFLAQEVEIETYPVGIERLFALRDFQVRVNDKIVAEWRSKWLIMHMENRRPLRPDDSLRDFASLNEALPLPFANHSAAPEGNCLSVHQCVGKTHIDLNKHLGSIWYLKWALELFYAHRSEDVVISTLDILFRQEAREGDELSIKMHDIVSTGRAQVYIEKENKVFSSMILNYKLACT